MVIAGRKTNIKIGNVLIGDVTEINPPEESVDSIEVTTLEDDYRKFIPGLTDAGDSTISGNYIKGQLGQVALRTALKNKTIDPYTITFPSGTVITFEGFITRLKNITIANNDDKLGFEATFKITGEPTFTEAV